MQTMLSRSFHKSQDSEIMISSKLFRLQSNLGCNRAGPVHMSMENGPNGKKWENRGKFGPIENGDKMAEKYFKKGNRPDFPFFFLFGHFFPVFDRPRFSTVFPFFPIRPVFHCVPGPHDCKTWEKLQQFWLCRIHIDSATCNYAHLGFTRQHQAWGRTHGQFHCHCHHHHLYDFHQYCR